jgi:hypothetical protein
MSEPSLFGDWPWEPREHARSTDPDTSLQAAHELATEDEQRLEALAWRCLVRIANASEGRTAREVGRDIGEPEAWKRVSDLKRLNLITYNGKRVDPYTHRQGYVCWITTRGRLAIRNGHLPDEGTDQ